MAIIRRKKGKLLQNPLFDGVSGQVGKQFILKQYKHYTVFSNFPDMSGIKPSKKQKVKRSLFQEAVKHARSIINDPEKKAAYAKKLKGKSSVYHAAVSEYMKANK